MFDDITCDSDTDFDFSILSAIPPCDGTTAWHEAVKHMEIPQDVVDDMDFSVLSLVSDDNVSVAALLASKGRLGRERVSPEILRLPAGAYGSVMTLLNGMRFFHDGKNIPDEETLLRIPELASYLAAERILPKELMTKRVLSLSGFPFPEPEDFQSDVESESFALLVPSCVAKTVALRAVIDGMTQEEFAASVPEHFFDFDILTLGDVSNNELVAHVCAAGGLLPLRDELLTIRDKAGVGAAHVCAAAGHLPEEFLTPERLTDEKYVQTTSPRFAAPRVYDSKDKNTEMALIDTLAAYGRLPERFLETELRRPHGPFFLERGRLLTDEVLGLVEEDSEDDRTTRILLSIRPDSGLPLVVHLATAVSALRPAGKRTTPDIEHVLNDAARKFSYNHALFRAVCGNGRSTSTVLHLLARENILKDEYLDKSALMLRRPDDMSTVAHVLARRGLLGTRHLDREILLLRDSDGDTVANQWRMPRDDSSECAYFLDEEILRTRGAKDTTVAHSLAIKGILPRGAAMKRDILRLQMESGVDGLPGETVAHMLAENGSHVDILLADENILRMRALSSLFMATNVRTVAHVLAEKGLVAPSELPPGLLLERDSRGRTCLELSAYSKKCAYDAVAERTHCLRCQGRDGMYVGDRARVSRMERRTE